jgi:TonB family protein
MHKLSFFSTTVAAALLGVIAVAAPKSGPEAKASTHTMTTKKTDPTEILATQLVLNKYQSGEDFADVCRRANFKNLALSLGMNSELLTRGKGEFETSEQYAQRANKLAEVISRDSVAVCLSPSTITSFSYHADDQRFEGELGETVSVWRDVKNLRPYRSKTRMGISVTVKPSLAMEFNASLTFPSYPYGCLADDYHHTFQFPYGTDDAPILKAIGRIVVLAKLEPPYVEKEDTPGNPTLDNPYDVYTHSTTVHIKPEKLVVTDYKGKEVWSCKVGGLAPLQPLTPQGKPSDWVSIIDYPLNGYRENMVGTVIAVLQVGSDGKVSDCKIVSSSGSSELDRATCAAWTKRAKFAPASDKDGNPVASEYSVSKSWSRYGL